MEHKIIYDELRLHYKVETDDLVILLGYTLKQAENNRDNELNKVIEYYNSNKDKIITKLIDKLHKSKFDNYKELNVENIDKKLGKPCYNVVNNKLIYDINMLDEHIIEFDITTEDISLYTLEEITQ